LKAAFDSRDRYNLYTTMEEFQIEQNLVALVKTRIKKHKIQTILTGSKKDKYKHTPWPE
jgi:hypothetical protein